MQSIDHIREIKCSVINTDDISLFYSLVTSFATNVQGVSTVNLVTRNAGIVITIVQRTARARCVAEKTMGIVFMAVWMDVMTFIVTVAVVAPAKVNVTGKVVRHL